MKAETYGLTELSHDLRGAAQNIDGQAEKVTEVALAKMKKHAQRLVRGNPHLPHLARSFTYDVDRAGSTIVGEVGGDWDKPQGKLDSYIEHGTPTSRPIPHWRPAAAKEVPIWEQFLTDAAAEAIGD